ncbi:MAG: Gfo/Idh/MocA family oxidoreductase [Acidobacteriota bacterium]|nr:Gfo/Idh/MocA family oxidoreductase [Acidobacteriota bacterium]
MAAKVRVGVVGAGQFGRNHVRVVSQSERAELTAVVDTDPTRAAESGTPALTDYRQLVGRVDAAIVSAPTTVHAEIGCFLLESGIDVLVEKPIAPDLASADRLIRSAARHGRILQVGHLERFNPAILALEEIVTLPLFFEIHRMSVFSPRSLDIDVVLDLMIHDLDIVLALARGELDEVHAAGISILSSKIDIANVRLQFQDGCVANLTASRVSTERVRKLRLFQPQQYISLDYAKRELVQFTVGKDSEGSPEISIEQPKAGAGEPLNLQFEAFLDSVVTRREPKLDGVAARRTLEVALAILAKIEEHSGIVSRTLSSAWKP